jgi:uncharacterized protein
MASSFGLPILGGGQGVSPRFSSLLIKPASALCNLDCRYCFYLDRESDPYTDLPRRVMSLETLERLVDTFLFYSYPNSVFAFQGGEPMLMGLKFFQKLIEFQQQYGRDGQNVSNALQTNAVLINDDWCTLFREYNWLLGVSIDGPEEVNDAYRLTRGGQPTWRRVMRGIEILQKNKVEFNILCVLSQANVEKPREVYKFFRLRAVHPPGRVRRRRPAAALHHHPAAVWPLPAGNLRAVVAGTAQGAHTLFRQPGRGPRRATARELLPARNLRLLLRGGV